MISAISRDIGLERIAQDTGRADALNSLLTDPYQLHKFYQIATSIEEARAYNAKTDEEIYARYY